MTQTKDWRYQRYFNNPNFGDGSDGNVSIIGPVTLTRDVYYNNLELTGLGVLNSRNFKVHVAGTLTLDATIHSDGANAVTFTGGAVPLNGTIGAGGTGGNGNIAIGGSGGSGATAALGGQGGNGGAGTGGAGGPAAPTGPLAPTMTDVHNAISFATAISVGGLLAGYRGGGGGGGGGGNGGAIRGGGGGGGGNVVLVTARRIILGPLGLLRSRGGNGAAGNGANAGGGGAGGGGLIICSWEEGATEAAVLAICSVPPGTPGASGGGAGVAGAAGAIGRTRLWKMH